MTHDNLNVVISYVIRNGSQNEIDAIKNKWHDDHGNVFYAYEKPAIRDRIIQRRKQIAVHSCIYYELSQSIVPDSKWDNWARELHQLQAANPDCLMTGFMDNEFKDWQGSASGHHLNHRHPWTLAKVAMLLERRV